MRQDFSVTGTEDNASDADPFGASFGLRRHVFARPHCEEKRAEDEVSRVGVCHAGGAAGEFVEPS